MKLMRNRKVRKEALGMNGSEDVRREWTEHLRKATGLSVTGKKAFCAYNAFIDYLEIVDEKKLELVFNEFGEDVRKEIIRNSWSESEEIKSIEEVFSNLIHGMRDGKALHIPCYKPEIIAWLEKRFGGADRKAIGGQAGIIANQLGMLGARLVLYAPRLSKDVAEALPKNVLVPVIKERKLVFEKAIDSWEEKKESKVNWIFEFGRGLRVKLGNEEITVPRSNRFIISSPPKAIPAFKESFKKHLSELGRDATVAIFAGYHYLQPWYENGMTYKKYLEKELENFMKMKRKNKRLIIHYEFVPVDFKEIEAGIVEMITKGVDSLGINEVETREVLKSIGFQREANEIERNECAFTLFKGGEKLLNKLKLKRVHIHNLGYFVMLLRKGRNCPKPEKAREACLLASIVANVRSEKGGAVKENEIRKGLEIPLSEIGFRQLEDFAERVEWDRDLRNKIKEFDKKKFLRDGIIEMKDYYGLIVPAQVARKPRITTGLGDTISSIAVVCG
ncbi:hypothetical protein HY991_05485 [Candidatus Micrarchaeota archaeon]|nr:hypothetical protein [Candidatus Micrarchaeota archaeon]